MLASIIIPFFNSSLYLKRVEYSIQSYLNNSMFEIIFIDDCSNQTESELLNIFIQNLDSNNIFYIKNKTNYGAAVSRKLGIQLASGEYIAFLDSDDAWAKNRLFAQINHMKLNNLSITGGITTIIEENEFFSKQPSIKESYIFTSNKASFFKFLFKNYYSTPSVVVLKNAIREENFSSFLRYSEDYDCWRRILYKESGAILSNSFCYSFKHPYISNTNSLSSNLFKMSSGEIIGLYDLFKKDLKPWIYLIIPFAILFSILKAFKRIIYSLFFKKRNY